MSQILFITKWADQELFPTPRSTVIAACCLTVSRAGKWQGLDVVAQAMQKSQLSYTMANILYKLLSSLSLCPYVWHTLMAITQIKSVLTTEPKGFTFYSNSRLGCRHIILQSPRKFVTEPRRQNGLSLTFLLTFLLLMQ